MSNNTTYQKITQRIIDAIKSSDTLPWQRPWKSQGAPRNVRGNLYRGINPFILTMRAMESGFDSPFWLTFNQVKGLNGQVNKGAKSETVIFWKWCEDAEGEKYPVLRFYRVFNLDETTIEDAKLPKLVREHLATMADSPEFEPLDAAENIVKGYNRKPGILYGGERASYRPTTDTVHIPNREAFKSADTFYSTLFHELAHSTGHKDRLNRKGITDTISFASENYSQEELVAEMTATFLASEAGIDTTVEHSAAYIKGWLTALENDHKLIITAASQANKAADHILGREWEKDTAKSA